MHVRSRGPWLKTRGRLDSSRSQALYVRAFSARPNEGNEMKLILITGWVQNNATRNNIPVTTVTHSFLTMADYDTRQKGRNDSGILLRRFICTSVAFNSLLQNKFHLCVTMSCAQRPYLIFLAPLGNV